MCSHYEAPRTETMLRVYGVAPDQEVASELWPGYQGPFVRSASETDPHDEAAPTLEALAGTFGLLPFWAKDERLSRRTYNARSETVASKPSYRAAWRQARHCIIPAAAIYEPDWRSGRAVPTRIGRADGEPMNLAGLWERWTSPAGEIVHSYTMLTINADDHDLMRQFHRPGSEKRMVVILPQAQLHDWLSASAAESADFLQPYPAERLIAEPRQHMPQGR